MNLLLRGILECSEQTKSYKTVIIAQSEGFNFIHILPQKGIGEEVTARNNKVTVINELNSMCRVHNLTTV